jgi:mannose-6-phosphate isomerase-like protein (cupin superfamily)
LCFGVFPLRAQSLDQPGAKHGLLDLNALNWRGTNGLELATIDGDPEKEGSPYSVVLRLKSGRWIPPHWHPNAKHIVVLEGTLLMGTGEDIDESRAMAVSVGGVMMVPAREHHCEGARGETVLLLYGIGPLTTNLVHGGN